MSENENNEQETVIVSNEEGEQETFDVLYRFEQDNGQKYILLTPSETEETEEANDEEVMEQEVYAFRYEGEGESINLIPIEEDKEWDMIEEVLNTLENEWNAENHG
ncbi:DUF1292 domain-containing protein [Melghirimyces algeriensis]|uniref:UPF0473 protein SAMN06264849_104204 n=1 Tax=Melghirimyces algeriensis TaxID=910412 RepID=A0A521CUY6_9BACL|nr:DUF1292 domain-containing protein [Melghirimyces algeriensis]SMO63242.1 Protein of unknown function [Melghirimyces algeriensis]